MGAKLPTTTQPTPAVPLDTNVPAAQAVIEGTQSPQAKTLAGTAANLTATPLGATGLTVAQNAGFAGVGGMAIDEPALPAFGWIVTLLFQRVKMFSRVNQDNDKWIWLLGLSFVVVTGYYLLALHGDWILAIANGIRASGMTAANSMSNYHSVKPLGWFSSAVEEVV